MIADVVVDPSDVVPNLLLLFPGPVHDLVEHFRDRLERLSRRYRGTVVVAGGKPQKVRLGRFDVVMLHAREGTRLKFIPAIDYLLTALSLGRQRRAAGDPFDAVVTYDPLRSGLIGLCTARACGMPLIVEVNGDYTARDNYRDIESALGQWAKRNLFMLMERVTLRRAGGIKLLFPDQINAFQRILRDPVIRTFPNFVDLAPFRNLEDAPEVLFVGHPYYLKGVDLLIQAFKSVSDAHPTWRLKILGWFPDPTELNAAIAGHPRISVHPPVYHREIPEHIGRCGIFVLPSRTEAMGRVLLEAMACGKPRIGAAVGGIPTVIRDGEDGLLFQPGNAPDLAKALSRLMSDETLRRRLGESGARRAREEFSADAYFERIAEFYGSVIPKARGRRVAAALLGSLTP